MPQMAPLNWLTLFLFFLIIFMLFNSINYFSMTYNIKHFKTLTKKIPYNWKW